MRFSELPVIYENEVSDLYLRLSSALFMLSEVATIKATLEVLDRNSGSYEMNDVNLAEFLTWILFICRKNGNNSGALPQQSIRAITRSRLRAPSSSIHRHNLLLLHAQMADTSEAYAVIYSCVQEAIAIIILVYKRVMFQCLYYWGTCDTNNWFEIPSCNYNVHVIISVHL